MGILDSIDALASDPKMAMAMGLLSAAGPSARPIGLGQAMGAGLGEYQQAKQMQEAMKAKQMQTQMQQMQIEEYKRKAEQAKQQAMLRDQFLQNPNIPDHIRQGVQAGMIDMGDLFKPQKVGEGEKVISPMMDMLGGKDVLAAGDPKRAKTTIEQKALPGGMWQDFYALDGVIDDKQPVGVPYSKRATASETNIGPTKIQLAGETEQAKAYGKTLGELRSNIATNAFTAPAKLKQLERMEQLLQGVEGGKLAPTGMEIASMANSLGLKIDPKLGNKEASEALSREIAGSFRQPGTGPMTDKDFENFLKRVPDLSKTAEGRKQITSTMRLALQRDIQAHKLASEYAKRPGKNGNIDDGFAEELANFYATNPVIQMPSSGSVRSRADAILGGK